MRKIDFKTFMKFVIRQRMRMNRGLAWINYFMAPVATIAGVMANSLTIGFLVIVMFFIIGMVLGYVEETRMESWHYENEYNVRNLNPYFEERFNKLEKKINKIVKVK